MTDIHIALLSIGFFIGWGAGSALTLALVWPALFPVPRHHAARIGRVRYGDEIPEVTREA